MHLIEKEAFQTEVLDYQGLCVVDYFGDGCVPCQALLPDIEALAEQYQGKVKFVKFNTTKARRLAISQKILGLPTISIYKNGEKVDEVTKDDATKASVQAMIEGQL